MDNEIFQKIFDMLQPVLPTGWKRMILYAGYTVGSYSMKFYTSNQGGEYTDCFSQPGTSRAELIALFMRIDKILAQERKVLDAKNKWSVMTMIVESDGNIKVEFEYADISENALAYEKQWKETYIK